MDITPFQSIGKLAFGDTRKSARAKIAAPYSIFRKDVGAEETDSFDALGLHLYSDPKGHLEFVEGFEPLEVTFQGIRFLGRDLQAVVDDMMVLGFVATESDAGTTFLEAGIALDAPGGVIESVAAFRKGYYD